MWIHVAGWQVEALLERLEQLLTGIALMQEITPRTRDNLVSFGTPAWPRGAPTSAPPRRCCRAPARRVFPTDADDEGWEGGWCCGTQVSV